MTASSTVRGSGATPVGPRAIVLNESPSATPSGSYSAVNSNGVTVNIIGIGKGLVVVGVHACLGKDELIRGSTFVPHRFLLSSSSVASPIIIIIIITPTYTFPGPIRPPPIQTLRRRLRRRCPLPDHPHPPHPPSHSPSPSSGSRPSSPPLMGHHLRFLHVRSRSDRTKHGRMGLRDGPLGWEGWIVGWGGEWGGVGEEAGDEGGRDRVR